MEGGGDGSQGKAAIRQGMDAFLRPIKDAARRKALHWTLVACGSRGEAYRLFKRAVRDGEGDETQVLLVDSEASVATLPRAHLRQQDGWDLGFASDATVHLMVQVMETWIVADPDALARYYGRRFNRAKLPPRPNLEEEPKVQIEERLRDATKRTSKGSYHKIKHARELLTAIDPAQVHTRCRNCKRLFKELERIIAAA